MAELVDALVSNTSGFTSIPVRPRVWVLRRRKLENSLRFSFLLLVTHWFAGLNVGSMNISDQRKNLRDFHFMHII